MVDCLGTEAGDVNVLDHHLGSSFQFVGTLCTCSLSQVEDWQHSFKWKVETHFLAPFCTFLEVPILDVK